MSGGERVRTRMRQVALPVVAILLACGPAVAGPASSARADQPLKEVHLNALQIIEKDPSLAGAMYACLYRLYKQGLGVNAAQQECEIQLPSLGNKDVSSVFPNYFGPVGGGGKGSSWGGGDISCPGSLAGPAARGMVYGKGWPRDPRNQSLDLGGYTWGGAGEVKNGSEWYEYRGLSENESEARKREAVEDYFAAEKEWGTALDNLAKATGNLNAAKTSGDPARIADAEAKLKAAEETFNKADKKLNEAKDKAKQDPNKAKPGVSRLDPDAPNLCGADLLATLRECDRVSWQSGQCQQLYAELHNCADPALIYPDPETGAVQCGEPVAPEDAAETLKRWCQENTTPAPGEDPCSVRPTVVASGTGTFSSIGLQWNSEGGSRLVCGSPSAHVAEDSCVVPLKIQPSTQHDVKTVLLWGLDHFGGPVFILPADPPGGPLLPR
jgi:hypothetical protein